MHIKVQPYSQQNQSNFKKTTEGYFSVENSIAIWYTKRWRLIYPFLKYNGWPHFSIIINVLIQKARILGGQSLQGLFIENMLHITSSS
jgi:hypothetical protein